MKILITGSSGLVGTHLIQSLSHDGHAIARLVRSQPRSALDIRWDADTQQLDPMDLQGIDAVVHLAGENIAGGRWNAAKKQRIRDSRVLGTQLLVRRLLECEERPATLVCASAIGYYGHRGAEILTEGSDAGEGFLPDVCREWEAASDPASAAGIRVVKLRIGVVLTQKGGALANMLPPFRLGLGGKLGSGQQYFSWISLDDLVAIIVHALEQRDISGVFNAVAPAPVTNQEFTRTLGKVLRRPTVFTIPAIAARLALGEMADALLLASTRVIPKRLQESSFRFEHPELEGALRRILLR